MQRVKELAIACDRDGLFAGPDVILTAGGSAAFDIVARELPMRLSKPVLTLLRSGCYVTHDSGNYERLLAGVKARSGGEWQTRPGPAAGARSLVASAIVPRAGAGDPDHGQARRLVRHRDADCPQAFSPGGGRAPATGAGRLDDRRDERPARVPALGADEADPPQVGDLIGCGISHPCTTFDKWRVLFTVDDDYRVTGAIRTYF